VTDPRLPDSSGVARRLAALADKPLNFDLAMLHGASLAGGWEVTDLCQRRPDETPGPPVNGGSWEIARRLMRGYEFPLERRDMLLKLHALGIVRLFAGVRVGEVYLETRELEGQSVHVWGWNYRTLAGHVEMGQMDWEVWKWPEDGRVEFRVHAISRPAPIPNPIVRTGFHMLRGRERRAFLDSTRRRMRAFTELALDREGAQRRVRAAAADLTARTTRADDPAHDAVANNIRPT